MYPEVQLFVDGVQTPAGGIGLCAEEARRAGGHGSNGGLEVVEGYRDIGFVPQAGL